MSMVIRVFLSSVLIKLRMFLRVASTVDAILLSHSDTLHLGALPYAMKHLGLSAPVFATEPVYRLGLLTMYDHYLSRKVKHLFPILAFITANCCFMWIFSKEFVVMKIQMLCCLCSFAMNSVK